MPFGDYTKENNFGELTGCESNTDGAKSSARPADFCDSVTCQSTLDVKGKSTLNETEVVPPSITIGGETFVPMDVQLCVGISGGGGSVGQNGGTIKPPVAQMQTFRLLVSQG